MRNSNPKVRMSRLERRALKQRWNLTEEQKAAIAEKQVDIAINSENARESTSAAKAILEMERQNQVDDIRNDQAPSADKVDTADIVRAMIRSTAPN